MADALFDLPVAWLGEWSVRKISLESAEKWMAQYHYLGTASRGESGVYGVFAGIDGISCVVLSLPNNANGVATKLGLEAFPGNIEIARVAVHPDAPKNTASRSISLVLRQFHKETRTEWVFSYADKGQGHHGGIYQALNAIYCGISPERHGYLLDGKPIHPRTIVRIYGSESAENIERLRAQGMRIEKVAGANSAKHLYVLPIGPRSNRKQIRNKLRPIALPYPKRESTPCTKENDV